MRPRYLLPSRRRAAEREMREEFEALAAIAGRRELGNLTLAAEDARAAWGWNWLAGLRADLRYALRVMRRQPALVAVAVLSLALGIGANTVIFSFADAALLRPVPAGSGLLNIGNATPGNPIGGTSYPDYRDLRARSRSFASLLAYRLATVGAAEHPDTPARIRLAELASDNLFSALGVAPVLGRAFLPAEALPPGEPVAVLSFDYWQSEYGGDRTVLGRRLRLNGMDFTIVGVAPRWFTGLERFARPSLYLPLAMARRLEGAAADPLEDRGRHDLQVRGRLAPGVSRASARAELALIGRDLERAYPSTDRNRRLSALTDLETSIQQTPWFMTLVLMLMGLVALVLIIACANVANLLLARARARRREMAVRLAIGAGRFRLLRQLLTESLLLALLGGAAGLALAYTGIRYLAALSVPSDIPFVLAAELDGRVLLFSLGAALASCLFFGLAPALQTVRADLVPALKSGGDAMSARRRTVGRNLLVVGQIALALVLLVATGMFLTGFRKLLAVDPGFRTDHLITMETNPALLRYSEARAYEFYRKLVDRARAIPGVRAVALAETIPLSPVQSFLSVVPEGYQFPKGSDRLMLYGGAFDENFFRTMNVEIVRGRAFTADDRAGSRRVAIVNQVFARTYWPNQDPIGRRIRTGGPDGPLAEIVGVARTTYYLSVNETPRPYVYLPYEQNPRAHMTLVVESAGNPAQLAPALREAAHALDANLPVYNLRTVAALYQNRFVDTWRMYLQMVTIMGLMGLALALVGLYGLIAYSVSRRTPEIGVRLAIGATRRDVLKLILGQGLLLAGCGILLGGLLAFVAIPALAASFGGLAAKSMAAYLAAPGALLAVSAAACYLPARRAARLDPLRALRYE